MNARLNSVERGWMQDQTVLNVVEFGIAMCWTWLMKPILEHDLICWKYIKKHPNKIEIYFVQNTVQFKTSLCRVWLNPGLHYVERAIMNSAPSCVECGSLSFVSGTQKCVENIHGNALCVAPCLWIRNYVVRNVVELNPGQRSAIWLHSRSTDFIRVIFSPTSSVSLSSILYKFIFKLLWDNKLLILWNIAMEPLIL